MVVPIRKSGFIKSGKNRFLLSPDVLHYCWTKNHKNHKKCTLVPRLHPKSDFQFTKNIKTYLRNAVYMPRLSSNCTLS